MFDIILPNFMDCIFFILTCHFLLFIQLYSKFSNINYKNITHIYFPIIIFAILYHTYTEKMIFLIK